jgi:hypothetical protein
MTEQKYSKDTIYGQALIGTGFETNATIVKFLRYVPL